MNKTYRVKTNIVSFDKKYIDKVDEITQATSDKKAISNILFRWKKQHGHLPNAKFIAAVIFVKEI